MVLRPRVHAVLGTLLACAGGLVVATTTGRAGIRDLRPTEHVLEVTPGHIGFGTGQWLLREAPPQELKRLAASRPSPQPQVHQPQTQPTPPAAQPAAPHVKGPEARQVDAAKEQHKDAALKSQKDAVTEKPRESDPKPRKEAAKEQAKGAPIPQTALATQPPSAAQPAPQKETGKDHEKSAKPHPKDVASAQPATAKLTPKEAELKQQETSKQRLKEESAKLQEASKHQPKDAEAKSGHAHQQDGAKPQDKDAGPKPSHQDVHDKDKDAKHAEKDASEFHHKDAGPKPSHQDGHDKDKDAKHAEKDASELHHKDAGPKPSHQDGHDKDKGAKHAEKDASKPHDKDADPKHHDDKQVLAKDHGKGSESKHHGKQEEAKEAAHKKAEQEKAAKAKAEAEAAAAAKAKAEAEAAAAAKAKAASEAAAAAKAKAEEEALAKAKAAAAPLPIDPPVVAKPASQDAPQPTESKPSEAVIDPVAAPSTGSTQLASTTSTAFSDSASKLGGPVQDTSADPLAKTQGLQQQAGRSSDDKQKDRAKKADEKGSRGRLTYSFPPPLDAYKVREFLIAKSSLELLAELERRGYLVRRDNGAGLRLVTLPPNGPNAWDVQRELESSFPDTRLGLNYVYRTHKPYRGASQPEMLPKGTARKGCGEALCYGPKVINWHEDLAVCAAGLKVGMIDTLVDEGHPAFAPGRVKIINVAHKQDAPPAVHWHGTGVLSLMAGRADSSTPGLIPGAAFAAANVFYTNKDGELETDTAHLTEALAAMKAEHVRVVNMSLVGPQDDLVHERITDMATRDGVVFVAAAGNGGPDALPGYPAAYEEVIAVTAVDRNKASYDHANRGTYIDTAAPGVQILTALPGGKEGLLSGTSFAAPFVTAVVAVAYRDTGLEKAAEQQRGRLDPKGVMLAHLFRKDELQIRSPIKGHGLIRAPDKCGGGGSDAWASVVKPTPSTPVMTAGARPAAGSITLDSWQGQTIVQQASLPSEAAK